LAHLSEDNNRVFIDHIADDGKSYQVIINPHEQLIVHIINR
jgi:hypothetical protein